MKEVYIRNRNGKCQLIHVSASLPHVLNIVRSIYNRENTNKKLYRCDSARVYYIYNLIEIDSCSLVIFQNNFLFRKHPKRLSNRIIFEYILN